MMRPKLRIGDIVKLSKYARDTISTTGIGVNAKTNMMVMEVSGSGQEQADEIICKVKRNNQATYVSFLRKELWRTGHNIFDTNTTPAQVGAGPKNNDGRHSCYKCNKPTRLVGGGMYNVCANEECSWFEN